MQEEIKLLKAKTEELQAAKQTQEMYAEAIKAFGIYSGRAPVVDEDLEDDYEQY